MPVDGQTDRVLRLYPRRSNPRRGLGPRSGVRSRRVRCGALAASKLRSGFGARASLSRIVPRRACAAHRAEAAMRRRHVFVTLLAAGATFGAAAQPPIPPLALADFEFIGVRGEATTHAGRAAFGCSKPTAPGAAGWRCSVASPSPMARSSSTSPAGADLTPCPTTAASSASPSAPGPAARIRVHLPAARQRPRRRSGAPQPRHAVRLAPRLRLRPLAQGVAGTLRVYVDLKPGAWTRHAYRRRRTARRGCSCTTRRSRRWSSPISSSAPRAAAWRSGLAPGPRASSRTCAYAGPRAALRRAELQLCRCAPERPGLRPRRRRGGRRRR